MPLPDFQGTEFGGEFGIARRKKKEARRCDEEITELIKNTEKFPPPKVETLFDDVYENMPDSLRDQKEAYLNFFRMEKKS